MHALLRVHALISNTYTHGCVEACASRMRACTCMHALPAAMHANHSPLTVPPSPTAEAGAAPLPHVTFPALLI
eukprot:365109-Chlamydomonas_euryale.AAC.1